MELEIIEIDDKEYYVLTELQGKEENYLYTLNSVTDSTVPVVSTEPEPKVIAPVRENAAEKINYFYDKDSDEATQQKSLIYFENTYIQNRLVRFH